MKNPTYKKVFSVFLIALILTIFFVWVFTMYQTKKERRNLKHFSENPEPETSTTINKIEELRKMFKQKCMQFGPNDGQTLFGKMCTKIDNIKIKEDKQSYTINKEKIYLCLTDEKDKFYSNNMLTYVLLHEFAHTLCKSVGHTPEFHTIFEQLLKEAIEKKLYDPSIPVDPEYCKHNKDKDVKQT